MSQPSNNGPSTQPMGPRFKNKPVLIIAAVIVIAVVLILVFPAGSKGDKQASETIRKFQNAVAAEDTQALKKLLSVDDEAMEATEDRLYRLIQHMKEEPEYYEETLQIIAGQQALLEEADYVNTGLLDSMSPEELLNAGELYLKKESGFLSETFKIGVRPQYLNITLENDNGTIKVDGKEILKVAKDNQSSKMGPLFPGDYQVDLTTMFEYADKEITESETVSLFGLESETDYSRYVTGEQVKINSDLGEVQVYLNDKPTPFIQRSYMDTEQESSDYFYPAFDDGSQKIYGVAKFPWGEAKSEPVIIEDLSSDYDITPKLLEETAHEVIDFVRQFLDSRAKAYGSKDVSELEKIYPHHEGDLLQGVLDGLGSLYYSGAYSERTLKEVEFKDIWISDDPLEDIKVYYDIELDQYVIQVTGIVAEYILTLSDGEIDDIDNTQLMNLSIGYEDGAWTVLKVF
ncbi:hypothetical protein P4H39_09120 [Paenibacillus lautus]|uniref:TcaA 3rd/4th domain-containing protein n=1 Tax=Paenibacillus lautus TaxID=1401 RepID=UPI002DB5793C|nr:hypothetical protein [Paenibacillus lautus]MEC0202787.1 hypothetical protein [Paenibacillus lautus]